VQLPASLGVLHAGTLAAEPVRGVLLAVLIAGHDLQSVLIQVSGLGQLDRLAEHPRAARAAVRDVPDGAERA
jgi:hypothetical protein